MARKNKRSAQIARPGLKPKPKLRQETLVVWVMIFLGVLVVGALVAMQLSAVPATPVTPTLTQTAEIQRLAPEQAKALVDQSLGVLYDVRSAEEYREKHAAGAISFPESEQEALVNTLPKDKALIFY